MFSPHCCGFYSATGLVFMAFVHAMLSSQPFFISGIEDVDEAKSSAMGALLTFAALFAICVAMIAKGKGAGPEYDTSGEDYNRLNIDLRKNYGEGQNYGAVSTDSY